MSLVSFVRAAESNYTSVKRAVERSLDLIGFNFEINPTKIAIKPNLCFYYDYSTGETTDPRFVAVLVDILRERLHSNPEIFIVESNASAMKCKYAFRMLGYERIAKKKNVKLVNLSKEKCENVQVKIRDKYFRFCLPRIICESNLLINVPKIKYMPSVKITCALKNIYGCNAYDKKHVYHKTLSEAIVGINKLIKSDLVVVDGMIVSGIETRRLGLVMASEDPVAIDAAASRILGFNPKSVRQIMLAAEEGIGNPQFISKGESLTRIEGLFPKRMWKDNIRLLLASFYLRYLK